MKRVPLAIFAAVVVGLLAASRAFIFDESPHEAMRIGLWMFGITLVLAIVTVLLRDKH